jgi:hypothetical protein
MKIYYSFTAFSLVATLLFLTFAVCSKSNIYFSDIAFSKIDSVIKRIASSAHAHTHYPPEAFPANSRQSKSTKHGEGILK